MDELYSTRTSLSCQTNAQSIYNVGAYIRLSIEDDVYDSDSVQNQREMLSKFINLMPGWLEYKFYVDNGVSGGTFNRPAFLEMMEDVRSGHVNLVLVKDMSRFGRNYLDAGRYLEEEFPALDCRFVALADNVDTESGENDIIPFLNALNDFHIKNLSDRVKAVLHAKARDGQKIGRAPYGYHRDTENYPRLIVDKYAAGVVRRIFEMRAKGAGYTSIVKALNTDGILSPRLYYRTNHNLDISKPHHNKWVTYTVREMLRNEIYIGTAVQLKNMVTSYRDKREVRRPPEEWIRVENAFPAIIDRETWDAVQEMNNKVKDQFSGSRAPRKSLFSGLPGCADCGAKLILTNSSSVTKNGKRTMYLSYMCRTYHATAGASCSRHSVSELTLKKIVLGHIREMAEQIVLDEDAVLRSLMGRMVGSGSDSKVKAEQERRSLRQQLQKLELVMEQLYEGRVTGVISGDDFSAMLATNEAERLEKGRRLTLLEQSKENAAEKLADIQHWMQIIRERASLEEIDRDTLEALVERIEIGERTVAEGEKRQNIRIVYKFVGLL